jgi:hypothetical protein
MRENEFGVLGSLSIDNDIVRGAELVVGYVPQKSTSQMTIMMLGIETFVPKKLISWAPLSKSSLIQCASADTVLSAFKASQRRIVWSSIPSRLSEI